VDQIFERLERLVKAWVNTTVDSTQGHAGGQTAYRSSSGDSDLDAAMAELDDFLDTSKTETERREEEARRAAEQARLRREEQARKSGSHGNYYGSAQQAPDTKKVVEDAYRYLGCQAYAPFAEVKTAYKKLLFKYHPDRNSSTPEKLKSATETSSRINAAYQIVEAYEQSKQAR
jgi:DnaJ-domain-containing protein 1